MGQCFSAAVQQVVTELQQEQENDNNNNNQNNKQQQQQQQQQVASSSWAQVAGGSGNESTKPTQQHHTSNTTTTTTTTTTAPTSSSSSSSKVSPIYHQLPSNAEHIQVRNVYDGDTMTLIDERRVRLLGIDTPEIKQQQPFAQEAKNYTKQLIETYKDSVYLAFEPNQAKEDHYGRLLGFVYVQTGPNQYICINEGIIEAGLASVYSPNQSSKIQAFDKYIALQSIARTNHRGLWQNFQGDTIVYKTTNGTAYHQKSCQHISHSHHLIEIKVSVAAEQGLHPCRTCCTGAA
jgi:endonuclease YncB( thermonuclease family)